MDLIDRQAAINVVKERYYKYGRDAKIEELVSGLEKLPSAEPRKGMWCVTPDGKLVCSYCYENPTNRIIVNGNLIYDMTPIRKRMRFCPNCGAMMSEGEEDE